MYFGPLQMQARTPAFLVKWQRKLRHKQRTLADFARARQAVPGEKVQEIARQVRWITELLASPPRLSAGPDSADDDPAIR
ncbi:hypothetical protein D3C84_1257300 [compost metagenome]